jgi:TonB family protein
MNKKKLFALIVSLILMQSATISAATMNGDDGFFLFPKNKKVYTLAETMPQFPGGMEAMMEFVKNNVKYPVDAIGKKIQGRVVVSLVVKKDGSIDNVKLVRSIYPSLDEEAIRVIKMMPKWIPGTQKGKAVNVKYCVPVSFRLE